MKPHLTARDDLDRLVTVIMRSHRFWRRAAISSVVAFAIGVAITFTMPRRYVSETVIMYKETFRTADITGGEGFAADPRRLGLRLRELVMSRGSLEPIIKEYGLYPSIVAKRSIIDAVDEMRRHVVFKAREGDTFLVSFEASDPVIAESITARLGNCIVEEASRRRSEQARLLQEFLKTESDRGVTEVKQKERALAEFLTNHREFTLPAPGSPATFPVAAAAAPTAAHAADPVLDSLEAQASKIMRRLHPPAPAGARGHGHKGGSDGAPKAGGGGGGGGESREVTEARRNLEQKQKDFTEKHPDVVAAKARLKEALAADAARHASEKTKQPAVVAAPVAAPAPAATAMDSKQRTALQAELAELNRQIEARRRALPAGDATAAAATDQAGPSAKTEMEFLQLQREVNEAHDRQRQLDDRLARAEITANSVEDNRNIQVSILDKAFRPTHPVSTGRVAMIAGSMAAAMFFGLFVALFSAFLDDHIYDRLDLQLLDLAPVLAVIPKASARRG